MSRAWRAAALDSRPLSLTFRTPWAVRCWLSRQAVVRTVVLLETLLGLAAALAHEAAEAPAGTARTRTPTSRAETRMCGRGRAMPSLSPGPAVARTRAFAPWTSV